jgi:hypothetical protein
LRAFLTKLNGMYLLTLMESGCKKSVNGHWLISLQIQNGKIDTYYLCHLPTTLQSHGRND